MFVLIFIVILALLIFSHELGHFLVAKLSGLSVEEFGFGFPPRLWAKKIGGTMYSLNALPFGGFVKLPDTAENKPLIVLAGVIFNILLAFVLLWFGFAAGLFVSHTPGPTSLQTAFLTTGLLLLETTKGLLLFLWALAHGAPAISGITGPVGIALIVKEAASAGFGALLQLTTLLSLSLAVVNLVPFPALDGGRLLFIALENLRGKPLRKEVADAANTIGFALLILLMVVVTYHDITRLFNG